MWTTKRKAVGSQCESKTFEVGRVRCFHEMLNLVFKWEKPICLRSPPWLLALVSRKMVLASLWPIAHHIHFLTSMMLFPVLLKLVSVVIAQLTRQRPQIRIPGDSFCLGLGCNGYNEQISNGWPSSLLTDEQINNKVRVENQPVTYIESIPYISPTCAPQRSSNDPGA